MLGDGAAFHCGILSLRLGAELVMTAKQTSLSHPLTIDAVALPGGGQIGMTFCPGKKYLTHWIATWMSISTVSATGERQRS